MRTSRYEIFLKAAELGNLSRTAEYFSYTPSAISQTVKALEEDLGFALLNRSGRRITLTADGEVILPVIRDIVSAEKRLADTSAEIRELQTGTIRMGTYVSIASHWLPPRIIAFREKYPGVRFEIQQSDTDEMNGWLAEERVDLVFMMDSGDSRFDFLSLFDDDFCVLLPEGHPLETRRQIHLKDLVGESLIMPENDLERVLQDAFAREKLDLNIAFTSKEDYSLMAMVESGLGVGILPGFVLHRQPYHIRILPLRPRLSRHLGIFTRKNAPLPWAARKFIEFVLDTPFEFPAPRP